MKNEHHSQFVVARNLENQQQRAALVPNHLISIRCLHAFNGAFLHPRHQAAQPLADFFDGMVFTLFEERVVVLVAGFVFLDPTAGKFAGLNVL